MNIKDVLCRRSDIFTRIDQRHFPALRQVFLEASDQRLDEESLKNAIAGIAEAVYSSERFHQVFVRMDRTGSGSITWDEFISYLLIEFDQMEVNFEYTSLLDPIPERPKILKSFHRHPVMKIALFPVLKFDRSESALEGTIVTCSKDGMVNFWSPYLQLRRTGQSTCPDLKVQPTLVLDMVVLADVNVICTSSSERDLRFYDTSANKFSLRVMITSLKSAISAMSYTFNRNIAKESKLALGTINGRIILLFIKTIARGPFRSKPGDPLLNIRYERVVRGDVADIRVLETNTDHNNFVQQIAFYNSLHGVLSCALNPANALVLTDTTALKSCTIFNTSSGVCCFAIKESAHIIASGGTDCLVRLWNSFVPNQATGVLHGHHTTVVHLTFQDDAKLLYSLSKDRRIKVWNVTAQTCLQTYLDLHGEISHRAGLSALYLEAKRQWIVGSNVIAAIGLSPQPNPQHTDGNSHTDAVSVLLFNRLFKVLVSCGFDSYIIVWNPWDGRRMSVVRNAHTKTVYGQNVPVKITAASFDPFEMRLITGAHDGTMKIWDFNTGTCLRNLTIDTKCEVSAILWTKNRIFSASWNKCLTEFSDFTGSEGNKSLQGRNWEALHDDEISTAAVRIPQTIATASFSGELVFWRLETGQAYAKFNVMQPKNRIKIQYKASQRETATNRKQRPETFVSSAVQRADDFKRISIICMQFLDSRTMDPEIGTLAVGLNNGMVQIWAHHSGGGFLASFRAVHSTFDYVSTMTTDGRNEFLFTGSIMGYLKTWLLKSYCTSKDNYEEISMPSYRLRFPFMWGDRFVGRAQKAVRLQPLPLLLNSFRGHLKAVTDLVYLDESQILISSSGDMSVRMWSLSGQYIQTIGTFKEWRPIMSLKPISVKHMKAIIPADLDRKISSTTLRVLMGGYIEKVPVIKGQMVPVGRTSFIIDRSKVYGETVTQPVLGNFYDIPKRVTRTGAIEFDTTFSYIPVYQHINLSELEVEEEPKEIPLPTESEIDKK